MLNYLTKKLKNLFKLFIEARERQAAMEIAQMLSKNPDFKAWSTHELFTAIMDKKNPVFLDKTPVNG